MRVTILLTTLLLAGGCRTLPSWVPFAQKEAPPPPAPKPPEPPPPPAVEKPAPPPVPAKPINLPYEREDLAKLRAQAREVLKRQADAFWKSWIYGTPVELGPLYADKAGLYSSATLDAFRKASEGASPETTRAFDLFVRYVAGELVSQESGKAEDRVENEKAAAVVKVGDVDQPWRTLDELISAEPSAPARAALYASEAPLMARLAPLVRERDAALEAASRRYGFASAAAFAATLREVPLAEAAELARRTLEATEAPYRRAMERISTDNLALPFTKLRRSDVPRLLRYARTDQLFAPQQLMPRAQAIFKGIGFNPQGQRGLNVNLGTMSTKNARPVCFPVDVPGDVRVSVRPAGGAEVLRELVHEMTHAEAYLHVSRTEWEFRVLGGAAVQEGVATALASVVDDPAWLRDEAKAEGEALSSHVRQSWARRLLSTRLAAARVLLETGLLTGEEPDPAERWRKAASRAFGFEMTTNDAQRWVLEDSGVAASVDDLRGALLAGLIESTLATRFGASWWKNPAAGPFLKEIWNTGSLTTLEDVVRKCGADALSPDALARLAEARLTGL